MGEWKRGKDAGRRSLVRRAPVAVGILYVARVVTVLMIIGALGLVVLRHFARNLADELSLVLGGAG
jgi:hypothetical protein